MVYEYECTDSECRHEWEAEQRIVEEALRVCPKCEGETAKRLISRRGGFVLQGRGWYRDGYSG